VGEFDGCPVGVLEYGKLCGRFPLTLTLSPRRGKIEGRFRRFQISWFRRAVVVDSPSPGGRGPG